MPPRSKNTGNIPNDSGNGRNQQDENQEFRHDQGQPPEMIQMMQTFVGVVQQQVTTGENLARMMEQRRGHHGGMIEFKRLSPPTFKGTTEPMEAEKWIIEMEKVFKVLECSEGEKVTYAAYMLRGDAYDWWRLEEDKRGQETEPWTWELFKSVFYEKYFPKSIRFQKEKEFIRLTQGNMTVAQYEAEFSRLAKFAPTMVVDEETKARRFKDGLRFRIKQGVVPFELTTFRAVVSIIPVSTTYAYALFDPGATHSFISTNFAKKHNFKFEPMESELCVDTPVGGVVVADSVCKACVVKIADRELLADLTLLEMRDFDIILGMDWLAAHYAIVDCHRKKVIFQVPGEIEFCFVGSGAYTSPRVISALQARRMMRKGCKGYLATVRDTQRGELKLEDILVVKEFPEVFPEDLSGLPPDREIEFSIDLLPGSSPISKAPYRMAL
ncbi:uncharacterized protein LOC142632761 [Castanea sativa]|uniref:uncharacterized protein LOC142632761 n=1 Tax=Castanea sativa TaxID=21020 RepID=UPI003F64BEF5